MSDLHPILSPIPGIFYRRSSPQHEPFVEVGSVVRAGDAIGMVEIMKSFHTLTSDVDGEVVAVLEDVTEVEPGAVLIQIRLVEQT